VPTTRSRPRGREIARHNSGGVVAEHRSKIYGVAIGGVIVIIGFLALTSTGHVVDLAVQHFMLFYAGVFALIALCASVAAGLIATDRMFLNPGHRVLMQSAHRAISFGALVFLVIHIVTEILAQRVHVIDAFVPFLSPFRTFYIGLGTISSDLIVLLVITGVLRKRFTSNGNSAWRWRAIHYTSYVAFVFGVWHGLLAGRPAKPYVDWSYGFVIAFVALGLAVRILANSLRPKESLSAPPVAESASSGAAPMRAAAMFAQLGVVRAATPAAMAAAPGGAGGMLAGAPTVIQGSTTGPMAAVASLPAPVYEPGYDGPPRYAGAPRNTGPIPRMGNGPASGPMPRVGTGPMPRVPGPGSGSFARPRTGPMPVVPGGPGTGPMPRVTTGGMPRVPGAPSGPSARPVPGYSTGPLPRVPGAASGPSGRPMTGPMPRVPGPVSGPMTGPMHRGCTGPMPRMATGPMQPAPVPAPGMGSGPHRRPASGPAPSYGAPHGGPPQRPYGAGAPQGGQGQWDGQQWDEWASQEPWDSGIPDVDPRLRYRMPGPGLPGYRPPADQSRDGDNRR
jgi:DMSO/TMAO reductase YedYZ heme-binding membrane subunit